jgi:hypothetical protein
MTDAGYTFKKVTSSTSAEGLTYTVGDYIAEQHLLAYVLHQNASGWTVDDVADDDRPADADRTYNPPAYITGEN